MLLAADPCAPLPEPSTNDPDDARAYAALARAAAARGQHDEAVSAWRAVLEVAATDVEASRALASECKRAQALKLADEALDALKRRDTTLAAQLIAQSRATSDTSTAALVDGMLGYEAQDDARARAALEVAAKDPALRGA